MRLGRIAGRIGLMAALLAPWLTTPAFAQRASEAGGPTASALPPVVVGPVTLRVLQDTITPVPATDGLVHLAYVAQITNLSRAPIDIEALTPVDFLGGGSATGRDEVRDGLGVAIADKVKLFAPPAGDDYASQMPGGASGIAFFDVSYPSDVEVPTLLAHRIVARDPATGATSELLTDPVPVACEKPVVLRPPLVGHRWWNGNGCCVVSAHRGATLPVNGRLVAPEQFAIDYAQIRDDGTCCTGPTTDLASWPFYGAPVLAAAAGEVVDVVRDEPDQVPGRPVVGVTAATAGGNLVIERIDDAHFVAYAHLRPGSIPAALVPGARLQAGDRVGGVGNSGNSTAPHLHFQVMDRPSMLNALGLPFVFTRQVLEGRVTGPEVAADQRYEAGGAVAVDATGAGPQIDRMPASGQVFAYGTE